MNKLLSHNEIDLLLGALSSESASSASGDGWDAIPYNLANRERIVRGRIPTLERIHERFSRLFRQTLSLHMRKFIDVNVRSTEILTYQEAIRRISRPASVNVFHLAPLRGVALLVFEQSLVGTLIDILFGGPGNPKGQVNKREFTSIEMRMIQKITLSALENLQEAWVPIAPLKAKLVRTESNPELVNTAPPNETMLMATFDVEIRKVPLTLSLLFPYSMYDPIRTRLNAGYQSENTETSQQAQDRLRKAIIKTPVELSVDLGKTQLSLKNFLDLSVGDVIPLGTDTESPLKIRVEGVEKFEGTQGSYQGHNAVQILKKIKSSSLS